MNKKTRYIPNLCYFSQNLRGHLLAFLHFFIIHFMLPDVVLSKYFDKKFHRVVMYKLTFFWPVKKSLLFMDQQTIYYATRPRGWIHSGASLIHLFSSPNHFHYRLLYTYHISMHAKYPTVYVFYFTVTFTYYMKIQNSFTTFSSVLFRFLPYGQDIHSSNHLSNNFHLL